MANFFLMFDPTKARDWNFARLSQYNNNNNNSNAEDIICPLLAKQQLAGRSHVFGLIIHQRNKKQKDPKSKTKRGGGAEWRCLLVVSDIFYSNDAPTHLLRFSFLLDKSTHFLGAVVVAVGACLLSPPSFSLD